MQEFKTDISLNGNQAKNIIIDKQDSFPPVSESYEGRKITLNGISYIFHNGAWQSVSEDLLGVPEKHFEEFIFQPTGDDLSIKDGFANIDSLQGNTIVWNQLVESDTTEITLNANQTYYCKINGISNIRTSTSNVILNVTGGRDMVINLSLMFSPLKANITTAEFEALFPNEYYPPCVKGKILSVSGGLLRTIGFNAYNGNYAKILKGQTYYLNGEFTSLGFKASEDSQVVAFELPANRLYTPTSNGYIVAEGENICINFSHSGYRDGEFEPYEEFNLSLDFIKNIKDNNGNLLFPDGLTKTRYYSDEIKQVNVDGNVRYKAIKRIDKILLRDLTWSYQSNGKYFSSLTLSKKILYDSNGGSCRTNNFVYLYYMTLYNRTGNYIACNAAGYILVKCPDANGDVELFKELINDDVLYYATKTPVEVFLPEDLILSYRVFDFGSEEYIVDKTPIVPLNLNVEYGFNAVDMIRNNYYRINELISKYLDFWSLTQANAETFPCEVPITNSTESIFPKLLASYGDYIHSRNIVVDLSSYSDATDYVFDLFGDITNVPTNVRYSIFIVGYNGSLKLDFPKQYMTNIATTHTPDGTSEERYTIPYSGATKIDFIKFTDTAVWVDVSNKM